VISKTLRLRIAATTARAIVVGALVASVAPAQEEVRYSEETERLFARAVEYYRQEEYQQSIELFDQILLMRPPSHRATGAAVMKAKALLQLDQNLDAARTAKEFLAAFPGSTYVPDAHYMLGITYARVRRYDSALEELLAARRLMAPGDSTRLVENTLAALDLIIDERQTVEEVRQLLARSSDPQECAYLMLKVAERELAGGNAVAASAAADSLETRFPGHPWAVRVAAIRGASLRRSTVKLGVLLPLMRNAEPSAVKQIGNDVYDGVLQAFEEYQADPTHGVAVTMVTLDTERDPAVAARGVRELADDPAVIGILGPAFSQSTMAAAPVAAARSIPLISPTANTNGIAAAGPTVFQANPDYETRGKAMAQYAVKKRGFQCLAVLAPEELHGKAMGEAFIAECLRLDVRVVAAEWYARGATDLSTHLQAIRRAAMQAAAEPMISFGGRLNQSDLVKLVQAGVSRQRLDSLVEHSATVRATDLLGPRARKVIDSLGIPVVAAIAQADSLEYPASGIDGIYVPISSAEEIGVVTSQMVYFNIAAQILGSGEWNDLKELAANKRYCTGVVFETDNSPDPGDPGLLRFTDVATTRLGKPPGRYALYGYDTARLVLDAIGRGAATRDALTRALSRLSDYHGIHSRIGFSGRRVNPWVFIMQYGGEVVTRLDEIRVDAEEP
jgi:branched-chain amino acid transport system substrate-binding protein